MQWKSENAQHQLALPFVEEELEEDLVDSFELHDEFERQEGTQRKNLERALTILTKQPIMLIINDNRSRIVSAKHTPHALVVRLHHMFLEADADTVTALASYLLQPDQQSSAILNAYIRAHADTIAPSRKRTQHLKTRGRYHNLQTLLEAINKTYFKGQLTASITWGRDIRRKRRQNMQMGSFNSDQNLIRIHPALDQHFVPSHYVSWIIYHELLHAYFGIDERSATTGKRRLHPAKFEFAERRFHDYEQAKRWEESNLRLLMRY